MPFQRNGKRDYKREREWELTKKRSRLSDRVKRNQARRDFEKKNGNLPTDVHVDHIRPLTEGGSNKSSNTRALSAKSNLRKEAKRKQRQFR